MEKKYDYLIVGAGLYGATFARLAINKGKSVLIIDKREHVGGNLYCENIEGINVHKYGPHIFHTSNKKVWDFVNSIVPFKPFMLNTMARYKNKLYHLPFNMNTFNEVFGETNPEKAKALIEQQTQKFFSSINNEVENMEEQAISMVGNKLYEMFIKDYSEKQWGRKCSEMPVGIINRLPIRYTFDNNYFNDIYQGIPVNGYNNLINHLISNCDVLVNTDYISNKGFFNAMADKIVYTGKIDEYFGYSFGELEYRSVRWDTNVLDTPNFQGNAVINITDKSDSCTRIIEHKHFETFGYDVYKNNKTVVSKEYSSEWKKGMEGYYPINDKKNMELYEKYKKMSMDEKNVIFGGRLAEYKYYDMDDVVEEVLKLEEKIWQ